MIKKYNDFLSCSRVAPGKFSASQRTAPSSMLPSQKDDAELVTPTNHSQSSTPTSSLPTVSAAALDGRSFDGVPQQQPRIIQSLHGLSAPPAKTSTPQLLTVHSAPEDTIKHCAWTSDQPRLYLKQAPTTTTVASLIKWANHPPWSQWRPSSCSRANVCRKEMRLRLLLWPLCGGWSPATPLSFRTKRSASSS